MPKPAWGALLAAHLAALPPAALAGCASSPPGPTQPAPPPSPKAEPEAASWGKWSPLLPLPPSAISPTQVKTAAFSKGVVVHATFRDGSGRCQWLEAPDAECSLLWFAPWKGGDDSAAALRPLDPAALGPFGEGRPAPRYDRLFDGRDGVYALRGISQLDVIGEAQSATFVLSDLRRLELHDVVDTASGPVAVGVVESPEQYLSGSSDSPVAWAPIALVGGEARVGAIATLPASVASTARDARFLASRWKQAVYSMRFLPSFDRQGKPEPALLLAWVEALPPKKRTAGASQRAEGRREAGRQSCGSAPSRGLSDDSVLKKLHLYKLSPDGKVLERRVLASTKAGDPPPELPERAVPGGVSGPRRAGEAGPSPAALPVPLPRGTTPQSLVRSSFDPGSGEGAVTIETSEGVHLVKIDRSGRPIGSPIEVGPTVGWWQPVRLSGGWALARASGGQAEIAGLEGRLAGLRSGTVETGAGSAVSLLPAGEAALAVALSPPRDAHAFHRFLAATVTPSSIAKPEVGELEGFVRGEPPAPLLTSLVAVDRLGDGTLVAAGEGRDGALVRVTRAPSGPWSEPLTLGEPGWKPHHLVVDVPGDKVVVFSATPAAGSVAVWLRAGVARPLPAPPREIATLEARFGPLGKGAYELLPAQPGDPLPVPDEVRAQASKCAGELRTGPRTLVLLCDEEVPGGSRARVGARAYRF